MKDDLIDQSLTLQRNYGLHKWESSRGIFSIFRNELRDLRNRTNPVTKEVAAQLRINDEEQTKELNERLKSSNLTSIWCNHSFSPSSTTPLEAENENTNSLNIRRLK